MSVTRRGLLLVAMGVLLLAGVGIVVVVSRSGDSPGASSADTTGAPPTSATVPATTTTEPVSSSLPASSTSSSTVAAPEVDPWEEIPILLFSGPAGEYRTGARFFVPFRVTLPEGWKRVFPELSDIVEISPSPEACETDQIAETCTGVLTIYEPLVPTVEDAVVAVGSVRGTSASEPEPIEINGVSGFRIVVTTKELGATFHTIRDGGVIFVRPDRTFVTYVLDVAGSPVVMILDTPADGNFDTEALPVVESIIWRALE